MGSAIIAYGLFLLVAVSIAVIFGIRSGQFVKNEKANSMPLEIEDPTKEINE